MRAEAIGRMGVNTNTRHLMTLRQAAEVGPFTATEIRRKIRAGVLLLGVHYTQPHRSWPLIVREAYLAYLAGADDHFRKQARRATRRGRRVDPNWVNWDVAVGL